VVFSCHAIDMYCSQFRSGLFSAKGTFLCQPRVERRESANVAEPWGYECHSNRNPERGGPKSWAALFCCAGSMVPQNSPGCGQRDQYHMLWYFGNPAQY